jgi:hypothetical protein
VLSAQSAAGLGSDSERERLIAASSAVIAFRSPMPAELAALAGSERVAEGAWSFDATEREPGRVTVTERHRARLDQDQVRSARVGEARIIAGGRLVSAGPAIPAARVGRRSGPARRPRTRQRDRPEGGGAIETT